MARPTVEEVVKGAKLPEHSKMQLITADIRKAMPRLRSTDGMGNMAPIIVKFFPPEGSWSWYALEGDAIVRDSDGFCRNEPLTYDGPDKIVEVEFFGMVHGYENELGTFCLSELLGIRTRLFKQPIERDMHFDNKTLKDVQ